MMDGQCEEKKESSIMVAFGRLDNEAANLDTQLEKLFSVIEPALSPQKQPETATKEPEQSDTCDVQANINQLTRKISRMRDNVNFIQSRVQL